MRDKTSVPGGSVASVIRWKSGDALAVALCGNHAFGSIAGGLTVARILDPNLLQEEIRMNGKGRNPMAGIVGGLLGGVLFGAMMQMMGMMGMVSMLVGSESVGVGWIVHLAISAVFGGVYALILGPRTSSHGRGVLLGAGYGVIAWVVGALVLMPLGLGMTGMVFTVGQDQITSLIGHLIFGVVLGAVYRAMSARASQPDHTGVGWMGDRQASR